MEEETLTSHEVPVVKIAEKDETNAVPSKVKFFFLQLTLWPVMS